MAKVVIDVDTSKKSLSVKVDGKSVGEVRDVMIYGELSGYFGLDIAIMAEDLGDMKRVTRLVASEKEVPNSKASEEFEGFKVVDDQEGITEELGKALFGEKNK